MPVCAVLCPWPQAKLVKRLWHCLVAVVTEDICEVQLGLQTGKAQSSEATAAKGRSALTRALRNMSEKGVRILPGVPSQKSPESLMYLNFEIAEISS